MRRSHVLEATNEETSYEFTSAAQVTGQSHCSLYGQWLSPWGPAFGERKLGWPGLTWVDKVSIKGATLLRGINSDLIVAPFGPPPRSRSRRWLRGGGPAWTSGHSPEVVWQRRTAGRTWGSIMPDTRPLPAEQGFLAGQGRVANCNL